jgi:hypothetical protein
MFNVFNNRKPFYNKNMMDYCRKSTEESIKKFTEREKLKQKQNSILKTKIDLKINNSQVLSNSNNGVAFFVILSVSSFIYYFLNARK